MLAARSVPDCRPDATNPNCPAWVYWATAPVGLPQAVEPTCLPESDAAGCAERALVWTASEGIAFCPPPKVGADAATAALVLMGIADWAWLLGPGGSAWADCASLGLVGAVGTVGVPDADCGSA